MAGQVSRPDDVGTADADVIRSDSTVAEVGFEASDRSRAEIASVGASRQSVAGQHADDSMSDQGHLVTTTTGGVTDIAEHVTESGRDSHAYGPSRGMWRPSAAQAWRRIRDARPVVLLAVASPDGIADALAALGARPVIAAVPDETHGLLASSGAVVIDAASVMTGRWGRAIAAARARHGAPPLVLIATLVDRSPVRCNEARRLVAEARPAVIRGSIAELSALVGIAEAPGAGHAAAASVAQVVAHRTGAIAIAWSEGEVATADATTMRSAPQSGSPAQVRIASSAIDAVMAATLACGADPLAGVRAAITIVESAVQAASRAGHGPGGFSLDLLDILAGSVEHEPEDGDAVSIEEPRTAKGAASRGARAALSVEPDPPSLTFTSIVDEVANRFEAGRVVPGSVPIHLLRNQPVARTVANPERWKRVAPIAVRPFAPEHDQIIRPPNENMIDRAIDQAIRAGASAVLVDSSGMRDGDALIAICHAVAVAADRGIDVAVHGRVDLATAGGAAAVWLSNTKDSLPVEASVAVASGRVLVIASVTSAEEAAAAIASGAGAITASEAPALDLSPFSEGSGVTVASLLSNASDSHSTDVEAVQSEHKGLDAIPGEAAAVETHEG
jgi:hydroxyethylthiazole kinase